MDTAAADHAAAAAADTITCNGDDHDKLENDADEAASTSTEHSEYRVEQNGVLTDLIDHQENGLDDPDHHENDLDDIINHHENGLDEILDHELLVANDSLKAYGSL